MIITSEVTMQHFCQSLDVLQNIFLEISEKKIESTLVVSSIAYGNQMKYFKVISENSNVASILYDRPFTLNHGFANASELNVPTLSYLQDGSLYVPLQLPRGVV